MTHTTSPQPQPSLSLSQSPTSGSCNQAGSPDSPLPPRISAVLNTYNAAEHLDEVLDALHGFDEIILVDMHSTDETRAIATRHGARIIDFERCGICEPARNAAIQAASNPWVLIVDADEIVPPALRDYLYKLISSPNPPAALRLPLRNYFMGCEMLPLSQLHNPLRTPRCHRLAPDNTCQTRHRRAHRLYPLTPQRTGHDSPG